MSLHVSSQLSQKETSCAPECRNYKKRLRNALSCRVAVNIVDVRTVLPYQALCWLQLNNLVMRLEGGNETKSGEHAGGTVGDLVGGASVAGWGRGRWRARRARGSANRASWGGAVGGWVRSNDWGAAGRGWVDWSSGSRAGVDWSDWAGCGRGGVDWRRWGSRGSWGAGKIVSPCRVTSTSRQKAYQVEQEVTTEE